MNKDLRTQVILTFIGIVIVKFLEDYFNCDLVYPFTSGLMINYLGKLNLALEKHNYSMWAFIHTGFVLIFMIVAVYCLIYSSTQIYLKILLFTFGYFTGYKTTAFDK